LEQPFWALPLPSGSARRLTDVTGHAATWSPDGSAILFATGPSFYIAHADGSNSRELVRVEVHPIILGSLLTAPVYASPTRIYFTKFDLTGAACIRCSSPLTITVRNVAAAGYRAGDIIFSCGPWPRPRTFGWSASRAACSIAAPPHRFRSLVATRFLLSFPQPGRQKAFCRGCSGAR